MGGGPVARKLPDYDNREGSVVEIFLQSLTWYPDETDIDVLADFTVRRTAIGDSSSNGGESGEASDLKFRICQGDVMPEIGIRLLPTTKVDIETQRVISDVDALVMIPRETWSLMATAEEHTRFVRWLTLVVGTMYLTGQHSV